MTTTATATTGVQSAAPERFKVRARARKPDAQVRVTSMVEGTAGQQVVVGQHVTALEAAHYRRAGLLFANGGPPLEAEVSAEQLAQLRADPRIEVEVLEVLEVGEVR